MNRPKSIWIDKGKEFAGEIKVFLQKTEGKQVHFTMIGTRMR